MAFFAKSRIEQSSERRAQRDAEARTAVALASLDVHRDKKLATWPERTSDSSSAYENSIFFPSFEPSPRKPRKCRSAPDVHSYAAWAQCDSSDFGPLSRQHFWTVLRAGLDVYKHGTLVTSRDSSPTLRSRFTLHSNTQMPPMHPQPLLYRSASLNKLKFGFHKPSALSDEGSGLVTVFIDASGTRFCWGMTGKATLRCNPAHCINLADIDFVSAGSSDKSTQSTEAPDSAQMTLSIYARNRAHPYVFSVDRQDIKELLLHGLTEVIAHNAACYSDTSTSDDSTAANTAYTSDSECPDTM